jgi:hypothetical protein
MARPANATTKIASPRDSLQDVYAGVERLLRRWVPPFKVGEFTVRGKESLQLVTPKPIVIPGAYGGKPTNWQFAATILQKGYVGFYLMGVYNSATLRKKLSPALLKTLKGKSCFHLKALDNGLKKDIASALEASAAIYKERGWL